MAEIAMDTNETKKKSMMMLIAAIIVSLVIGLLVGFYAAKTKAGGPTFEACTKLRAAISDAFSGRVSFPFALSEALNNICPINL